jgi:DNA-directed RNA polymerase specialized sigma24 family protein
MAKPFCLPRPYAHHAAMPEESALSPDEADRDRRISKVMPRVVKLCNQFRASLKSGERGLFPLEDLLQEVWLELMLKDPFWDPGRGWKYITFANVIVGHKLSEIRNRWHMVSGPKDTAARLQRPDDGSAESIRRTVRETSSFDEHALEPVPAKDRAADARDLLQEAIRRVSGPLQLAVLTLGFGLTGEPLTTPEIAQRLRKSPGEVVRLKRAALREMASILESLGVTCKDGQLELDGDTNGHTKRNPGV